MQVGLIQVGLTLSVLLVGLYHLYLDQFSQPKSDIQVFTDRSQLGYGEVTEEGVELHFELTANNPGDDNGYIDSGRIVRFEFSETEDFSDPDKVDCATLTTPTGNELPGLPRVYLKRDDEAPQSIVPKDEIVIFKGSTNIYTGDLQKMYSDYYSMRAVIEIQCRDTQREYSRTLTTGRLDVW